MKEDDKNTNRPESRLPGEDARKAADNPRRVIKDTTHQQWIIAAVVGIGLIAAIIYGVISFQGQVENIRRSGVIVEKVFVPQPETQITVGGEGLGKEEIPGNYYLKVRLDRDGSVETRYVDRGTYQRYAVGDSITLFPPRANEFELAAEEMRRQEARAREQAQAQELEAGTTEARETVPEETVVSDVPQPAEQ